MTEPSRQIDESTWRNRFIAIQMTRIGGTAVVLLGLLIWQSDMIVEGGSLLGFAVTLLGLFASFAGPMALTRRWRTPPEQ